MAFPPGLMPPPGAPPPQGPPGAPGMGMPGSEMIDQMIADFTKRLEVMTSEPPVKQRFAYKSKAHSLLIDKLEARRTAGMKMANERADAWDEVDNVMNLSVDLTQGAHLSDHTRSSEKLEHPWDRGIVVPITFAMTTVRLSQELSIFNARDPQLQAGAGSPEDVDSAKLMDGVAAYDCRAMNFPLFQYQSLWDVERYGVCVAYDTFEREHGAIEERPTTSSSLLPMLNDIGRSKWKLLREYNRYQNVDPRKFFYDPRVTLGRLQEGEWAGHDQVVGFIYIWERAEQNEGPYFNVDAVRQHCGNPGFTTGNQSSTNQPTSNGPLDELDKGTFRVSHMQMRLIPADWSKAGIPLGDSTRPEIWWFTWVDGKVLVRAHRSKYKHNQYTYAVAEAVPDIHSYGNLGFIERAIGLQYAMSWSVNSHMQAVRRMINNAMLYCPSAIDEADITNPRPGGHIRVRPEIEDEILRGRMSMSNIIQQLQHSDMTSGNVNDMNIISDLMQRMFAANDPVQGIPLADKRTLGEVQAVMASASQRISTTARLVDYQYNKALAERHFKNRMQFTTKEQWYRIDGELAYELEKRFFDDKRIRRGRNSLQVLIDAEDLQGSYDYIPITANDPQDPAKDPQLWQQLAQTMMEGAQSLNNPEIYPDQMVPDMREIYSEMFRRMGIKNVTQLFRRLPLPPPPPPAPQGPPGAMPGPRVVSDEEYMQGVEAGNFVPQGGAQ